MKKRFRPWLRTLSGLFTNISAGWLGVALITPNFVNLTTSDALLVLILDIVCGIVSLLISVKLEYLLEYG